MIQDTGQIFLCGHFWQFYGAQIDLPLCWVQASPLCRVSIYVLGWGRRVVIIWQYVLKSKSLYKYISLYKINLHQSPTSLIGNCLHHKQKPLVNSIWQVATGFQWKRKRSRWMTGLNCQEIDRNAKGLGKALRKIDGNSTVFNFNLFLT